MKTFLLTCAFALITLVGFGASSTIHNLNEKVTPTTGDMFIIDDGANNWKVKFGNLKSQIGGTNGAPVNNIYVTILNAVTNYVTLQYVTNQYVTTNYTDYSYTTNLYVTTNIVNTQWVTNQYVSLSYITNLFVTTNYTDLSFITNLYVTTNYADYDYVTNLIVKNLRADIAYISNTFVTNITVTGGQTNAYLEPNMFVFTDANKKLVSTLDGSTLTNLPISAQVWTNDGTASWLLGYEPPDYGTDYSVINGPPFFFTKFGSLYIGSNILQNIKLDMGSSMYPLSALSSTDSNQPSTLIIDVNVLDSPQVWNKYAGFSVTVDGNDSAPVSYIQLSSQGTNALKSGIYISSGKYDTVNDYLANYLTARRDNTNVAYLNTNGIWAASEYQTLTNVWLGATNNIDLNNQWQKYVAFTPCSITGLVNKAIGGKAVNNVLVTITNAASTNITLYYEGSIRTGDGARSWVITNACEGKLSLEYEPNGSTNGVFRMFY